MKRLSLLSIILLVTHFLHAQELPFREIGEPGEEYTAATVLDRYIEGLGFRLHWATEGLGPEDYDFRPSEDSRSIRETLEHIYSLCIVIEKTFKGEANISPEVLPSHTDTELRMAVLESLYRSKELVARNPDFKDYDLVFQSGEQEYRLPFWNIINGPLADAMYHTGQVIAFRRIAGNPVAKGVNVLTGKKSNE